MYLLPLHTPLLQPGDPIAPLLASCCEIQNGDILVISSKALATVEGTSIDLSTVSTSGAATTWSEKCGRSPAFCQAVLDETVRLNGKIVGFCPGAMVAEVQPLGMAHGRILTANAGLDESNVSVGFAIGWPLDPLLSAVTLHTELRAILDAGTDFAVIVTDSCVRPRRWGVTAFALTVVGMEPLIDESGREDLFGRPLKITTEAVADQLATAANFLMGNADQSIPAVVIRDHGLALSDYKGWVRGIDPDEDLFRGIL